MISDIDALDKKEKIGLAQNYRTEIEIQDVKKTETLLKTLPGFVSQYIDSISYRTEPKTRLEYVKDIQTFFQYLVDVINVSNMSQITCEDLDTLKKADYEAYMKYLVAYEKDGQVYTNGAKSLSRKLSSIRSFLTYLFEEELMETNYIARVKNPVIKHDKNHEINRLDAEEVELLLDAVENGEPRMSAQRAVYHKKQEVRDLAIITLLASSGIRVSECAGLDISDVNFRKKYLTVVRKGDKKDVVYFSDEAAAYLQDYMEERKQIKAISGSEDALFLSSRKQRMNVRTIEVLVDKYGKLTQVGKKVTCHTLRRTFGTSLYKETDDILAVANALGHENVTTTQKAYIDTSGVKEKNRNKVKLRS